jgi:hypothetical protein
MQMPFSIKYQNGVDVFLFVTGSSLVGLSSLAEANMPNFDHL